MDMTTLLTMVIGVVPLVGLLLWWWNNLWYGLVMTTFRSSKGAIKLPPGHMGLPIFGEMITFLWYFKFLGRPDDYINAKRHKYGDGIGMYKTHLFGKPTVIAFLPSTNKIILRDAETFILKWANADLVGKTSVVAVQGKAHVRLRSFVLRSINHPDALRRIALAVQPRMISALQSWSNKQGKITFYDEIRKVTFENIGKYFASFEPGPTLDNLNVYFAGVISGVRAYPLNIPGFTFHRALQCRRKAEAIFREELDKRRKYNDGISDRPINDLMDGLINMKDEEGNHLSDNEVLDNITSILVGGFQSTVIITTWVVYYLAKYPKVLQKLREENMAIKKSKSEQLITSDEILKLEYTIKVVDETIRLANIAPFVPRTATKDFEYKGYTIPKGWNMLVWLRNVHMDPINFDDPLCFNPDRWNGSTLPENFQAFGAGSRICAGNMLARLQLALFLHHFTTRYKWELVNPDAKVIYLPHPKPEDGVECRRKAQAIFREELEKRRNNKDGNDQPIHDLMDGLVNLKDEEGNHLSDIEVLDNITSLLLGGFESTVLVKMWDVYYLAKYPNVLQKIREENMALKGSKKIEQLVTSDEILKLEYTMKVVEETIRLANVSQFICRTTTKEVNYKGYTIPKGWNMILWLRYVHTDAQNYDDPLCFNPNRWDASSPPENLQAFGAGPRLCAGNMLARLQLALFIHLLSTEYKWELVNPHVKLKYLSHPKPEDGVEITIRQL